MYRENFFPLFSLISVTKYQLLEVTLSIVGLRASVAFITL